MIAERVDFYVLNRDDDTSRLGFACLLAAKAWQQGLKVYLQVNDPAEAADLDDMLWKYQAASFIPHARTGTAEAAASPVLIGHGPAPEGWRRMLVSLTRGFPEGAAECNRVADLIGSNEQQRADGRERFRAWRQLGLQPGTHEITL